MSTSKGKIYTNVQWERNQGIKGGSTIENLKSTVFEDHLLKKKFQLKNKAKKNPQKN